MDTIAKSYKCIDILIILYNSLMLLVILTPHRSIFPSNHLSLLAHPPYISLYPPSLLPPSTISPPYTYKFILFTIHYLLLSAPRPCSTTMKPPYFFSFLIHPTHCIPCRISHPLIILDRRWLHWLIVTYKLSIEFSLYETFGH